MKDPCLDRNLNIGNMPKISYYCSNPILEKGGTPPRSSQAAIAQSDQSHDREVPRWEIFMKQELRFGTVGITEKKNIWADYEHYFRTVFSSFRGQKQ